MQRFRRMKSLQKFALAQANVHYNFKDDRRLVDPQTYKPHRTADLADLAEWQMVMA